MLITRGRKILFLVAGIAAGTVWLCLSNHAQVSSTTKPATVIVVGGVAVHEDDILPQRSNRAPTTRVGPNASVETAIEACQSAVVNATVKEFHLTASEREIQADLATSRNALRDKGYTEEMKHERDVLPKRMQAYAAIFDAKIDPADAFAKYLAFSPRKFRDFVLLSEHYRNPAYRSAIVRAAASEDGMLSSELIQFAIEGSKLARHVDKSLAGTDPVYSAYLQEMQSSKDAEAVKEGGRYLLRVREEWWTRRYSAATVEVVDEQFRWVATAFADAYAKERQGAIQKAAEKGERTSD